MFSGTVIKISRITTSVSMLRLVIVTLTAVFVACGLDDEPSPGAHKCASNNTLTMGSQLPQYMKLAKSPFAAFLPLDRLETIDGFMHFVPARLLFAGTGLILEARPHEGTVVDVSVTVDRTFDDADGKRRGYTAQEFGPLDSLLARSPQHEGTRSWLRAWTNRSCDRHVYQIWLEFDDDAVQRAMKPADLSNPSLWSVFLSTALSPKTLMRHPKVLPELATAYLAAHGFPLSAALSEQLSVVQSKIAQAGTSVRQLGIMHSRGEDRRIPGVTGPVERLRLVLRIIGADEHPNASVRLWMQKVTKLITKLLGKQVFGPEQLRRFEEDIGAVVDDELARESIWVVNFDVTAFGVSPVVTIEFGQKQVNGATLGGLGNRLVRRHPALVEQQWWRNMVQAL